MSIPLKITVPADFGIQNLDYEIHNNIFLQLEKSEEFKANSMILSYNSPVFKNLFLELHQSSLDMDDFSADIVKSFIRALYAGKINIEQKYFREFNKLGKVFEVEWFADRCTTFWQDGLNNITSLSASYTSLKWLVDEALFAKKVLKNDFLNHLFTERLVSDPNRMEFVKPYMQNYSNLDNSQLDFVIVVTKAQPEHLLNIMRINIEKQGYIFDRVSRHLLENIDLLRCLENSEAGFEEMFDILTGKIADLSITDIKWINNLYRVARKKLSANITGDSSPKKQCSPEEIYQKSKCAGNPESGLIFTEKASSIDEGPKSITKAKQITSGPNECIDFEVPLASTAHVDSLRIETAVHPLQSPVAVPQHKFKPVVHSPDYQLHPSSKSNPASSSKEMKEPESKKQFASMTKPVLMDNRIESFNLRNLYSPTDIYSNMDVDNLLICTENGSLPDFPDLYDFIEALFLVCYQDEKTNIRDLHVKEIIKIMKLKKWKPVHPYFLHGWNLNPSIAKKLQTLYGGQLSSTKGNYCLQGFWGKTFKNNTITAKNFFFTNTNFFFDGSTVNMPEPCQFYLKFRAQKSHEGIFEVILQNLMLEPAFATYPDIHLEIRCKANDGGSHSDIPSTGILCWRDIDGSVVKKSPDGRIDVGPVWCFKPDAILSIFAYIHV